MLLAPTYPDIDSERQVVLEEIAMYEDEPQDRVHDILAEAVFGRHPLGRRVLGEAEVISSVPVPDIEAYRRPTTPAPVVVAPPGISTMPASSSWRNASVRRRGGGRGGLNSGAASASTKETEQFHICFGAPGIVREDDRRYALAVLDSIFGGSTSSRLFREVREKRGLAYSVGSYNEQYTDSGMVAT
jgi:predicted Zn-dependent peptidase